MGISDEKVVAVIMVGGPTKCTGFRPLSLNIPKPLFPLAGQPMVHHPISACKRIPNLAQIYLVGFYEERELSMYVLSISTELRVPVRYLREDKPHDSAVFHSQKCLVVAAGANLVLITRGIEKTTRALVSELKAISKEVEDCELADVAAVSPGNNNEIGNMIAEAMSKVG